MVSTRIVHGGEQLEHPPLLASENLLGSPRHTARPRVDCSHVVALLYDRDRCVDEAMH
jgi:hypothetical protein